MSHLVWWQESLPQTTLNSLAVRYPDVPEDVWNHIFRLGQHHYHHHRINKHVKKNPHLAMMTRKGGATDVELTAEQKADAKELVKEIHKKDQEAIPDLNETKQKMFDEIYESRRIVDPKTGQPDEKAIREATWKVWSALEKFVQIFQLSLQKKMAVYFDLIADLTSSSSDNSKKENIAVVSNAIMNEYHQKNNEDNSWTAYFKSAVGSLFHIGKTVVVTTAKSLWFVAKNVIAPIVLAVGNAALATIKLIFQTGFKAASWISKEPRTAKMALIIARMMKQRACKHIGLFLAKPQVVAKGEKEGKKDYYDQKVEEVHSLTVDQLKAMGKEALRRGAESAAAAAPSIVNEVGGVLIESFGNAIPFLGPLVKGAGHYFLKGMTEAAAEAAEFYIYYSDVTRSFSLLVDFLDPRDCLLDLCSTYTAYAERIDPESRLSKTVWSACRFAANANYFKSKSEEEKEKKKTSDNKKKRTPIQEDIIDLDQKPSKKKMTKKTTTKKKKKFLGHNIN